MTIMELDRHHRFSPWTILSDNHPAIIDIYKNCLVQPHWKNIYMCSINDPYECKKYLELYWNMEYRDLVLQYLRKAYSTKLSGFYKKSVRFQYADNKKKTDMSLITGVDMHGYGWNLIGLALQEPQIRSKKDLFYAYIAIQEIKPWLLEEGRSLKPFWTKDPVMILMQLGRYDVYHKKESVEMESIYDEFLKHQLKDWDVLQVWMNYPQSCLMMIVEYKYARFVFNRFEKKIKGWLWKDHKKQCHHEEEGDVSDPVVFENLLYLFTTHRLPVSTDIQKRIKDEQVKSEYYNDQTLLQKMVDYTPYSKKGLLLLADDIDHPLHPFHIKKICIAKQTYRCVMEYVYIQILIPYLGEYLSFKKIQSLPIKQLQQFSKFQKILDWSINRFIKFSIRDILSRQDTSFRDALLETKDASLQYHDPYDLFIGYSPIIHHSNQWGKELERLRHSKKKNIKSRTNDTK